MNRWLLFWTVATLLAMGCATAGGDTRSQSSVEARVYTQADLAEITYYVNRNLELEGLSDLTPDEFRAICANYEKARWEYTDVEGLELPKFSPDWESASDVTSALGHLAASDLRYALAHQQVWQHASVQSFPRWDTMVLTDDHVAEAATKLSESDRSRFDRYGYSADYAHATGGEHLVHMALAEAVAAPSEIAGFCQHWLGPDFGSAFATFAAPPTPPPPLPLSEAIRSPLWVHLWNDRGRLQVYANPAFDVDEFDLDVFIDGENFCNAERIYGDEGARELSCGSISRGHQSVANVSAQTPVGDLRCERNNQSDAGESIYACEWR